MKLTKIKKFLADAIHASGNGWHGDTKFAIQDADDKCIWLMNSKPTRHVSNRFWNGAKLLRIAATKLSPQLAPNRP